MSEPARLNADHVMGPYGPVTLADLPPPNTIRWTIRRKAEVVAAVLGGLLSLDEAIRRYALHQQEFKSWCFCLEHYGVEGLRSTHTQFYQTIVGRVRSFRRRRPRYW
jgi:hypothetical protein